MEYMKFSLVQLKELAKSLKIPHYSTMRKPQLLAAIEEVIGPSMPNPEVKKPEPAEVESVKTEDVQAEAERPDTAVKEYARTEGTRSEYTRIEAGRSEYIRPESTRTGYVRPEYTKSEYTRSEPAREENTGEAPSTIKRNVSEKVLQLIGDHAEQYAAEALDVTGRIGMSVDRLYALASGDVAEGILEVMQEGYGFIRSENFLPGEHDVYVSYQLIKRHNLRTGDILCGGTRLKTTPDDRANKYAPLLFVKSVNGFTTEEARKRSAFEKLTPIYPNERIQLAIPGAPVSMRIMDLLSPIGKGQRGMIVAPPKAGKTTLIKQIAKSVSRSNPDMTLIVLLIDERPEEVTDIKEAIEQPDVNAQVIYSTFDELPDHHKRVSEMVLARAKRLVEHGKDVMILLDSITRLARAYNLTVTPSGRTLSGGLDPAALYAPKRFFGAARNMREGGSLTILATALVETGSRMDDVVFEEFKGTGNMELVLNRKLQEKRVFPAIDIAKSSTRNDNLLLTAEEQDAMDYVRRAVSGMKGEEAAESVVNLFIHTKNNEEFMHQVKKIRLM